MDYKEIKRKLDLTDTDISKMFGYKSLVAYTTSSAKPRIEKGIEELYKKITMRPSTSIIFKGNTAKRVWLNESDHLADPKSEAPAFGFVYGGINDNDQQVFINTSLEGKLSKREMEIYSLKEMTDGEIADKIGISEKSVEAYRMKIKKKGF